MTIEEAVDLFAEIRTEHDSIKRSLKRIGYIFQELAPIEGALEKEFPHIQASFDEIRAGFAALGRKK